MNRILIEVLYFRLLLKLDCQMKLQKFPLDNQTCVVNIGSCTLSIFKRKNLKYSFTLYGKKDGSISVRIFN